METTTTALLAKPPAGLTVRVEEPPPGDGPFRGAETGRIVVRLDQESTTPGWIRATAITATVALLLVGLWELSVTFFILSGLAGLAGFAVVQESAPPPRVLAIERGELHLERGARLDLAEIQSFDLRQVGGLRGAPTETSEWALVAILSPGRERRIFHGRHAQTGYVRALVEAIKGAMPR